MRQIIQNRIGSFAPIANGPDYKACPAHNIARCVNPGQIGGMAAEIGLDGAPAGDGQVLDTPQTGQVLGLEAQRLHHQIGGLHIVGILDHFRRLAARGIGGAQPHPLHDDARNGLPAGEALGGGQPDKIDAFLLGVLHFVLNCAVGEDLSFDAIRGQHDAVLIATGVYKSRDIQAPGVGARGIVRALDYLTASNRKSFGDEVEEFDNGELNALGKRVVVIGGGDTAMDCVRTAIRQGALSVKCLYRRDKANMPGSQREVQNAEEEGVDFVWLTAPKGFTGGQSVAGVIVQRMRLGAPDASGRQSPEVIEDADYVEPADLVVQALGFEPEDLPGLWGVKDLAVTRWGTIKADFRSHATALPGVYAAGDIVRGASLVVWAIRDGREAADSILTYLAQPAAVAAE